MSYTAQITNALIFVLILQLAGMLFSICFDKYINKDQKKVLVVIILVTFSILLQNHLSYKCSQDSSYRMVRLISDIYGYSIRPVILVLFIKLVNIEKKLTILWVLIAVNFVIHTTAVFSNICFTITENNSFFRGPLGYTSFYLSAFLIVYNLIMVFMKYRKNYKLGIIIPFFSSLIIVVAVLLDMNIPFNSHVSFLTVAIFSSSMFYYFWLHQQFEKEREKERRAEQRIQIMISQIQPHFLFNTLSIIQALCRIDPEKAFETAGKFGVYLRQNIDSLGKAQTIPFVKELEHTKAYSDIEQIRFPNIEIIYDIQDEDFNLPALTVQPMVENAIRHGVRIREHGKVEITTRKMINYHEIIIKDNGKGFGMDTAQNSERTHIGIQNVKERIEKICNGSFEIDSRVDVGTTVTIHIPLEDENDTDTE
ncbi:MAG: histidine kinase [Eubacterium sp.]|nr:histidine kinase [Eubacterium sp.]